MKFLVDNQLPVALARFLREQGVEAQHVLDVGLAQSSDRTITQYAGEHGMIVISKDEDFFHLAASEQSCPLVWVRLGNCRTSQLLSAVGRVWPRVIAQLEIGDRVVEIR